MSAKLTKREKEFLRDALHMEAELSREYAMAVTIRHKLGLPRFKWESER